MTESFLIHVTDGEVEAFSARRTGAKRYNSFAHADLSDIPIPALQLGLKVMDEIPEGQEPDTIELAECCGEEQWEWNQVEVRLKEIEPRELTGVEFLKSLPNHTVASTGGCDNFVKFRDGLHWRISGDFWAWEDDRPWMFGGCGTPHQPACEENIIVLYDPLGSLRCASDQ